MKDKIVIRHHSYLNTVIKPTDKPTELKTRLFLKKKLLMKTSPAIFFLKNKNAKAKKQCFSKFIW